MSHRSAMWIRLLLLHYYRNPASLLHRANSSHEPKFSAINSAEGETTGYTLAHNVTLYFRVPATVHKQKRYKV